MRLGQGWHHPPDPTVRTTSSSSPPSSSPLTITSFRFVSVSRRGCTPFERHLRRSLRRYFFFFAAFFFAIVLTSFRSRERG
jgi:hypothetical protein